MKANFFKNKTAIVTGSSQGIGMAIATEFLKQGAQVIINGRNEAKLLLTTMKLKQKYGDQVQAVCADVSRQQEASRLVQNTLEHFGKIDFIINNAGLSMKGNLHNLNPDVYRKVFNANVLGSVYPTIYALPYLKQTGGSSIFISSVAGIRGLPGHSAYCSSKMALRAIAESLRLEEPKVHTGLVYVGFTKNDPEKKTLNSDGKLVDVDDRSKFSQQTQEEVARAILKSIEKRQFITTLSSLGKINKWLNRWTPRLTYWIIRRNMLREERKNQRQNLESFLPLKTLN